MEENKEKEMEQWSDVKEKKGSGIIVFLLILIIVGLILFIYFNKDKLFGEKETKPEETEIQEEDEEEETLEETFDLNDFDSSKVINTENLQYQCSGESKSSIKRAVPEGGEIEFLKAKLEEDEKSVEVTVNWGEMANKESKEYTYKVTNFTNKVKKVYVSGFGQAMGQETVFYLMKDGTVEYTPLTYKVALNALENPEGVVLKSSGKVPNVEKVVMIAPASVSSTDSLTGGYVSTIAIKADGSFYDLREYLKDLEEYIY